MIEQTTFYIFNENGIIEAIDLNRFCSDLIKKTSLNFKVLKKTDIDPKGTVHTLFVNNELELTIYDHGYVIKVEGLIKSSIQLLLEIDQILTQNITFFISPSQRILNSEESKYPRGSNRIDVARFLDRLFVNEDYTSSLSNP